MISPKAIAGGDPRVIDVLTLPSVPKATAGGDPRVLDVLTVYKSVLIFDWSGY